MLLATPSERWPHSPLECVAGPAASSGAAAGGLGAAPGAVPPSRARPFTLPRLPAPPPAPGRASPHRSRPRPAWTRSRRAATRCGPRMPCSRRRARSAPTVAALPGPRPQRRHRWRARQGTAPRSRSRSARGAAASPPPSKCGSWKRSEPRGRAVGGLAERREEGCRSQPLSFFLFSQACARYASARAAAPPARRPVQLGRGPHRPGPPG